MKKIHNGNEVIIPGYTCFTVAASIKKAGLKAKLVDIDPETFSYDIESLRSSINKNSLAVVLVYPFSLLVEFDQVKKLADEKGVFLIEDAAQGIGVKFKDKPVGGFGDVGCLSFYADKTMTTGEGGMVLTNNDKLAKQCLILKHQGRTGRGMYFHEHIGYNFRLTDLQAAVGLAQLSKLPTIIARKKKNEMLYREHLSNITGVKFPYVDPRGFNVPFRINILVDDPESLSTFLNENDIGSRRFFFPLHQQTCYNVKGKFPNSVNAYNRGLSLPSSVKLTEDEIKYIADKIKKFYRA